MAEAVLSIRVDDSQAIRSLRNIRRAQDEITRNSRTSNRAIINSNRNAERSVNQLNQSYENTQGTTLAFARSLRFTYVAAVGLALTSTARLAQQFEVVDRRLAFVTENSEEASETFRRVTEFAQRIGIDLEAAARGFTSLAAATRGTTLEGEDTFRIFESVASASASLGLSARDTELALLAVQQIASRGVVSMEELRQQLGERIPGALQRLASGLNITVPELTRLVETGELSSERGLRGLVRGFADFQETAEQNVDTVSGALANLRNEITLTARGLLDSGLGTFLQGSISVAGSALRGIRNLPETITEGLRFTNLEEQNQRRIEFLEILQRRQGRLNEEQLRELDILRRVRDAVNERTSVETASQEEINRRLREAGLLNQTLLDQQDAITRQNVPLVDLSRQQVQLITRLSRATNTRSESLQEQVNQIDTLLEGNFRLTVVQEADLRRARKRIQAQLDLNREAENTARIVQNVPAISIGNILPPEFQQELDNFTQNYIQGIEEVNRANQAFAQSFEDSIVDSLQKGRFSFESFFEDIQRMALRGFVRQNITNQLFGLGTITGQGQGQNLFGDIGNLIRAGQGGSQTVPRFHQGGIVGGEPLFGNEVPAILQRGEGVFTPAQMRALGGTTQVTIINNTGDDKITQTTSRSPDGDELIEIVIGETERRIAEGHFNDAISMSGAV